MTKKSSKSEQNVHLGWSAVREWLGPTEEDVLQANVSRIACELRPDEFEEHLDAERAFFNLKR